MHKFISIHGEGWLRAEKNNFFSFLFFIQDQQKEIISDHILKFYSSYFDMPVIRRGLIKLLSQLGRELSVPEGALSFHHHLVSILADDYSWFGDITHLSCGKANACQKKKKFKSLNKV